MSSYQSTFERKAINQKLFKKIYFFVNVKILFAQSWMLDNFFANLRLRREDDSIW